MSKSMIILIMVLALILVVLWLSGYIGGIRVQDMIATTSGEASHR